MEKAGFKERQKLLNWSEIQNNESFFLKCFRKLDLKGA
jgi:hypothetical protein